MKDTQTANSISKYYNMGGFRPLSENTFFPEVHGALFTTCNFTLLDSRCSPVPCLCYTKTLLAHL